MPVKKLSVSIQQNKFTYKETEPSSLTSLQHQVAEGLFAVYNALDKVKSTRESFLGLEVGPHVDILKYLLNGRFLASRIQNKLDFAQAVLKKENTQSYICEQFIQSRLLNDQEESPNKNPRKGSPSVEQLQRQH